MTAYARVTVRGLKPPQRSEVLELLKRYSVKFWDAFDLGGKMMAARFALCVHVARATTRSSTRILGHEHARSLSSDTDFSGIKERTLVAVKPDGVQRRLIGEVIKRFEQRGFRLVGLKMLPVWEGHNVVRSSRMLVGSTDPAEAAPGTIRGDFSVHISSSFLVFLTGNDMALRELPRTDIQWPKKCSRLKMFECHYIRCCIF
uniref:nucleoside-diphosphate kinase n=1 Tax=Sinocyclocheilus rhinocerous TaxID=307959 RepID=A0A673N3P9_9TELE